MTNKKIKQHLPLVRLIAQQYIGCGVEMDDMVQEGCIGLMEADKRYDPAHGITFQSYASTWIRRAILRALDSYGHPVRLPQHAMTTVPEEELGWRTGLAPLRYRHDEDTDIEAELTRQEEKEHAARLVSELMRRLTTKQKTVIRLRFGLDGKEHTREEIAIEMGITINSVKDLLQRAILRMRKK